MAGGQTLTSAPSRGNREAAKTQSLQHQEVADATQRNAVRVRDPEAVETK